MQVSTSGKNDVIVVFSDDEVEKYGKLAHSQGHSLRVFVCNAIYDYMKMLDNMEGP